MPTTNERIAARLAAIRHAMPFGVRPEAAADFEAVLAVAEAADAVARRLPILPPSVQTQDLEAQERTVERYAEYATLRAALARLAEGADS